MAQTGFTPIQLYYSTIASATPTAGNLADGELAINITDGKLFYKDNGGVVQTIGYKVVPISAGGTGQTTASAAFNALSPITTAGDLIIGDGANSATRLAIGTNGYVLTSNGTTATWSAVAAQTYPGAGIAVSTGSAWTASLTAPSGAIVGTTDTQTLTNKTIEAGTFTNGYTEEVFALGTSGSLALNPTNGTIHTCALAGNPTFTDGLSSGQSMILRLTNGASYTVTWPTMTWVTAGGNVAPTLTANDTLVFWKISTTLYGAYVGSGV